MPRRDKKKRRMRNMLERLFLSQNGKCHYCRKQCYITKKQFPLKATIEHLVPRSKGGKNEGNVVMACKKCNNDTFNPSRMFPVFSQEEIEKLRGLVAH